MKRSKKFERLCFFFDGGGGTSATNPMDEEVEDEAQMTDRSTNLDDLSEEDWTSQDSFRIDSDFSDTAIGRSRATEFESETIASSSSLASSRRSFTHRVVSEITEAKMANQNDVFARVLAQAQATSASNPLHQQEPVVLESATKKLPNTRHQG